MRKSLSANALVVLMDQALFSATSFATTLVVAKFLGIHEFGIWSAYVLGLHLILSGMSSFVIQPFQVLVQRYKGSREYLAFTTWFEIVFLLALGLASLACFGLLDISLPNSFLVFGAGFLFHDFARRQFLALNSSLYALYVDASVALCSGLALFGFWWTGQHDFENLFAWMAWAYCPSVVLFLAITKPFVLNIKLLPEYFSAHWKGGKWLFVTAGVQWWSSNFMVVSAGLFLGAGALGALRLSQSLMGVLNILLQSFENYLLPQAAKRLALDTQLGSDYLVQVVRGAAVLFIPALAVIVVFSTPILVLAGGPEYVEFGYVLQAVCLLYVLVYLSQPLRLLLRGMLLNKHFLYGYLLNLAFSLAFSKLLISEFGLNGVLVGMAISQIIMMAYWTMVLQKKEIHLWKSFISF